MSSIRRSPRNTKKWEVRYRSPDGRQRTKGGFLTKADARAFAASIEHQIGRGTFRDPALGRITVEQWCRDYLQSAERVKRRSTLLRDRRSLENYLIPEIGHVPLARVTPYHIKQVVEPLSDQLKPSTVRGVYGTIKTVFNAAVAQDVIAMSPCRGVRTPTVRGPEKRILSMEELVRLGDAIDQDYQSFVYLGGVLGLRFSEIAGLKVGSIDFLRRTITIERTVSEVGGRLAEEDVKTPASRRTLTAPKSVIELLGQHLSDREPLDRDRFVLQSPQGGPLRYSNFHRKVWKPAVDSAGLIGLTIHGLRHSSVGLMIEVGAHPRVIQQRLGHTSISTTMNVYGSILPGVDDGVTDGLDRLLRAESGADVVQSESG